MGQVDGALEHYRKTRSRSRQLFDLLTEEAYFSQPIALRHPIVFYEGHLPAFSFNTVIKKALGESSVDRDLEQLFARGIDPHEATSGRSGAVRASWPSRRDVQAFAGAVDERVEDALGSGDRRVRAALERCGAVSAILEHEAMHQETLLYMWHRLPYEQKRKPEHYRPRTHGPTVANAWIEVPEGRATLGVDPSRESFGWDNEYPAYSMNVGSFLMQRHNVTNERFLHFVDAGGYHDARWWNPEDWQWLQQHAITHPTFWEHADDQWWWHGMFERLPLPLSWPVYVSLAEASAFARWSGCRLPTEAEFQRAAYGSLDGERAFPWGSDLPSEELGTFDFATWDPEPVGSHPRGASAWGIHDLVGNGWEWTCTPFAPFPGFQAMSTYPEYSADFFDGEHFVMKGASPATARELIRPTFRNWFRARYPYVYATFRCVRDC